MSQFCGFVASRGDFATLNWAVGDDSSIFVPQHRRLRSLPVFCRTHRLSGMRLSYLGLIWALFLAGSWTVRRFRRHRGGMKSFALTPNLWIPVLAWLLGSCGGQDARMLVLSRRPFGGGLYGLCHILQADPN